MVDKMNRGSFKKKSFFWFFLHEWGTPTMENPRNRWKNPGIPGKFSSLKYIQDHIIN
jgi:hypothetical protein